MTSAKMLYTTLADPPTIQHDPLVEQPFHIFL